MEYRRRDSPPAERVEVKGNVVRITFQLVAPKPSPAGVNVRIEACVHVIALMRQRKKGYVAKDGTHGLPVSSPLSVLRNQIRCDRRTVHGVIRLM
jgi:hypothetical protein